MRLKALIFDVDGTLAETEELHRRAFNETFAELELSREWPDPCGGWQWSVATYGRLLKTTGGKERIAAYLTNDLAIDAVAFSQRVAEIHARKTQRFAALISSGGLDLRPGIARLMQLARQNGLAMAVATTTSGPNVDALCRACFGKSASDVFNVVAAGDDVATKKPAPDVYLLALERLGLDAGTCIALEDSSNGVRAAKSAGLRCIASPSLYSANDDLSAADEIVAEFYAAEPLITRWLPA